MVFFFFYYYFYCYYYYCFRSFSSVLTGNCCCTRLLLCTKQNFFLFFYIHWPRVYYQSIIYTLQFSPKGGCEIQNYFNTHRTRQIITKKKKNTAKNTIRVCGMCFAQWTCSSQKSTVGSDWSRTRTFFLTTDVSGHAPAPRQPSSERDWLPGPGTWPELTNVHILTN